MSFWIFVLDSSTGEDGAVALLPYIGNGATAETMRPFPS